MYLHFKEKKVYINTLCAIFVYFGLKNKCMMAAANRTAFSPRFAANDCVQSQLNVHSPNGWDLNKNGCILTV